MINKLVASFTAFIFSFTLLVSTPVLIADETLYRMDFSVGGYLEIVKIENQTFARVYGESSESLVEFEIDIYRLVWSRRVGRRTGRRKVRTDSTDSTERTVIGVEVDTIAPRKEVIFYSGGRYTVNDTVQSEQFPEDLNIVDTYRLKQVNGEYVIQHTSTALNEREGTPQVQLKNTKFYQGVIVRRSTMLFNDGRMVAPLTENVGTDGSFNLWLYSAIGAELFNGEVSHVVTTEETSSLITSLTALAVEGKEISLVRSYDSLQIGISRVLFYDPETVYAEERAVVRFSNDISKAASIAILDAAGIDRPYPESFNGDFGNIFFVGLDTALDYEEQLVALAGLDDIFYVLPSITGSNYPPGGVGLILEDPHTLRTIEEIDVILGDFGLVVLRVQLTDFGSSADYQFIVAQFNHTLYTSETLSPNEEMANILIDSGIFSFVQWGNSDTWTSSSSASAASDNNVSQVETAEYFDGFVSDSGFNLDG